MHASGSYRARFEDFRRPAHGMQLASSLRGERCLWAAWGRYPVIPIFAGACRVIGTACRHGPVVCMRGDGSLTPVRFTPACVRATRYSTRAIGHIAISPAGEHRRWPMQMPHIRHACPKWGIVIQRSANANGSAFGLSDGRLLTRLGPFRPRTMFRHRGLGTYSM